MRNQIIYSDGSCINNGKQNAQAGAGVYYGPNDSRNMSVKLPGDVQTSNRAELYAAILAIRNSSSDYPLTIRTDSQYVVNGMSSWIHEWKRNGWKSSSGEPVSNKDLFQTLDNLVKNHPAGVIFEHVPGHSGDLNNDAADRLANEAASR